MYFMNACPVTNNILNTISEYSEREGNDYIGKIYYYCRLDTVQTYLVLSDPAD